MIFQALGEALRRSSAQAKKKAAPRVEGFEDEQSEFLFWFFLWLTLNLVLLAIALILAYRCGGGIRQYFAAALEPWFYILIRLAVPCLMST